MKLLHRSEIDGLRALAVVVVIFFHAGFPWFSGGFVGVDVFFVISGYLITSIILEAREAGTFTISGFYERRARRILPALFLIMFTTIPFALIWLPPHQLKEFTGSLAAVTLFSSNFLFWNESGYFAAAAAEKPLLHTWSLAIEEQFYVFFPLIVMAFPMRGRRGLALLVGLAAFASFALCAWIFRPGSDANFYLMPTRAWELLVGSLLVFIEDKEPLHARLGLPAAQALSAVGLAMIAYSTLAFDQRTPFPGIASLLPVGGAALVVAFAAPKTMVGRMLSQRWLAGIGLISYSAYLWHYPLFVFARLSSLSEPGPMIYAWLSLAVGVVAFLSWKYVEMPFRQPRRVTRPRLFTWVAVAGSVTIGLGLVGSLTEIGSKRFSSAELAAIEPAHSTEKDCNWQILLSGFPKVEFCRFGATWNSNLVVLLGDSHAVAMLAAADQNFREQGISGIMISNGHCRPIVGIYETGKLSSGAVEICERSQAALLEFLRSLQARAIILAVRWTFQLYPIDGIIDELGFDNGEGGREMEDYREYVALSATGSFVRNAEAKYLAIRKFIESMTTLDRPVLVLYPVPEVGWHIPNLNFKYLVSSGQVPSVLSTSARRYFERNAFVIAALDSITAQTGATRIKTSDILCNTYVPDRCVAQFNRIPLYFDDDHLSNAGEDLLVKEIIKKLE